MNKAELDRARRVASVLTGEADFIVVERRCIVDAAPQGKIALPDLSAPP